MPDAFYYPDLSTQTEALIRIAYGLLMAATVLQALPEARRFFLSERWGGYARSQPDVDAVQNPIVMPILLAVWLGAAMALAAGWGRPWPALVNVALCRYFFIHMRWKGILRGMGAPGFMAYWLGLVVLLLELSERFAPGVRPLILLVAQTDLAFIMLSAGIYKATAGYPRNHGMELGLCNPMWGYWWRWYIRRRPGSPVIWTLNQLAWGTEVVAALLLLLPFPHARELGALLLIFSFAFIATQIRLGFLCEMVIVSSLIGIPPDGLVASALAQGSGAIGLSFAQPVSPAVAMTSTWGGVDLILRVILWTYLALLPLAHAGLYYNFYARRALPRLIQSALDRYTNCFGIIIWRVFSVDLVNFFIRLQRKSRDAVTPISELGRWPRFNHVGEMICLTSLFTTLKYYPADDKIFQERILRYARTLPHAEHETLVFEYVSVVKRDSEFDWVPVGEFEVDPTAGRVTERWFDKTLSPRAAHADSPVHAGVVPGSYVPASR